MKLDVWARLAAITDRQSKSSGGGKALLFERVKGYPNARLANNIYASADRIARLFGVEGPRTFKFKAVEAIRRGRERGIQVTAEVTPHHLVLTDEALRGYDTNMKMNPPLRTSADRDALRLADVHQHEIWF